MYGMEKKWPARREVQEGGGPSTRRRIGAASAGIMLLLAALLMSGCEGDTIVASEGSVLEGTIRVSGAGSVTATPDMAEARIGVQTFAEEADEAVAANSDRMAAIIAALRTAGIAAADIQTTSFNVRPQRDYSKDEPAPIVGFWVDNTASVRIRSIDTVGSVLQSAIEAGANSIGSLIFTVDDADEVRSAARVDAVDDAHVRAETLAKAAGVKLGKVLSISESSGVSPVFMRAEFDAATAVPVEAGELTVTAQVEVVFEIR